MEVYLDNAATTAVLPEIAAAMADIMIRRYGNPSGVYKQSREAAEIVLEARTQVADLLGHTTSEITEMYYVKKDTTRLLGITNDFQV